MLCIIIKGSNLTCWDSDLGIAFDNELSNSLWMEIFLICYIIIHYKTLFLA